jgi:hypothetical protein
MDQKAERQQAVLTAEMKRRRRERIIIVATVIGIVLLTFIETTIFSKEALVRISATWSLRPHQCQHHLVLLLFLIVRNIVKLVYERRRGILGSNSVPSSSPVRDVEPRATFILFLWHQLLSTASTTGSTSASGAP